MTTLVERLLEWLAALGTSVVLLSATLPRQRRADLLRAFSEGLDRAAPSTKGEDYPRVTWLSRSMEGERHVRAASARILRLKQVDGSVPQDARLFALGRQLHEAIGDRGCVAVICNTVARAQRVYHALTHFFPAGGTDGMPELDLLHARYLFKDREERERRALLRFGSEGATVDMGNGVVRTVQRPRRAILVATQIIEQSLDLDFDLMITDLAPVDLILQRSGRLWRHDRQWRPAWMDDSPELWWCVPTVTEEGLPIFERGFERVYDTHVLLRSWIALRDRSHVSLPTDMDALIESVYTLCSPSMTLTEPVRDEWQRTCDNFRKEQKDERVKAKDSWLKRPHDVDAALSSFTARPQKEDASDLDPVHQALTRLTEPTVQVICLSPEMAVRFTKRPPYTPDQLRELLRHAVTLSDRRIVGPLLRADPPSAWKDSALLRHYRLLELDGSGATSVKGCSLRLHPELGVVIGE